MKQSKKEFNECLETLKHFMSASQMFALKHIYKTEESIYAVETAKRLTTIIESMPVNYETEEIPESEKIVYLHYFYGGSDWYIIEKDKVNDEDLEAELEVGGQYQAFGYAILNGDLRFAEWGSISINELIEMDIVELDFHFEPIHFSDLF